MILVSSAKGGRAGSFSSTITALEPVEFTGTLKLTESLRDEYLDARCPIDEKLPMYTERWAISGLEC
jgi:hypothetical protein